MTCIYMSSTATFSASLRYLARRLAAYLVDALVLFVGILAVQGLIYALRLNPIANRLAAGQTIAGWQLHLWVLATVSVPFWIYYAGFHSSARQATPGKRLLGLRVTTMTGERLAFGRALGRAFLMLIPFEWNHVVLFQFTSPAGAPPPPMFWLGYTLTWVLIVIYLGLPLFHPRRQSMHDVLVRTQVCLVD